jgi:hypothetical protein
MLSPRAKTGSEQSVDDPGAEPWFAPFSSPRPAGITLVSLLVSHHGVRLLPGARACVRACVRACALSLLCACSHVCWYLCSRRIYASTRCGIHTCIQTVPAHLPLYWWDVSVSLSIEHGPEPLKAEPENALSPFLSATENLRLPRRLSSDMSAEDEALRLAMKNAAINTPGLDILQKQLRINTLTRVDRRGSNAHVQNPN